MNLIKFEMPHISQTAILHTYHKYSMQCLTGRAYSGACKTFVSARIGQSYSWAYFAYKLARPRRLNM